MWCRFKGGSMATLEQRTVALQHLVAAKQALGLNAEAFAAWLAEQAFEIVPALFEAADDLDSDQQEYDGRTVN